MRNIKKRRTRLIGCALIVAALPFIIFSLLLRAPPDHLPFTEGSTANLPAALLSVEEDAFEGTAFRTLVFADGFLRIQDRAFSGMRQLRLAHLPASVEYIADSAFSQSGLEKIIGRTDSYAHRWAEKRHICFEAEELYYIVSPDLERIVVMLIALFGVTLPDNELKRKKRYIDSFEKSMRPQDRPELYPIDYRFP